MSNQPNLGHFEKTSASFLSSIGNSAIVSSHKTPATFRPSSLYTNGANLRKVVSETSIS